MQALNHNLDVNINSTARSAVKTLAYIWGSDASPLLEINSTRAYDFVVCSECLWRHEQVLRTTNVLLSPNITYSIMNCYIQYIWF